MLISPPFLPTYANGQTDKEWIDLAMAGSAYGHIPRHGERAVTGAYPVSLELGWHGGIHLTAPQRNDTNLVVRAIADGTIVFVRQPTQDIGTSATAPLNYGAEEGQTCHTNDGMVLIRHTTDIGTNNGNPVSVTYYSLIMHLSSILPTIRANQAIYRKDEIGQAGYIYGEPDRIHLEIFCDDANLTLLTGRNSGDLPINVDGRTSVLFGEIYFYLPAATNIYGERPVHQNPVAHRQPAPPTPKAALPPLEPLEPVHTTTEPLIVGIRYGLGDGNNAGNAYITTYRPNGTTIGDTPRTETDGEYNLYTRATKISEAYPASGRPAPSAVYELLRFGRIIGPDALSPATVPHWQQIQYPGGEGWVNLNATNVRKFSDADFPHWKGWSFINDSADQDSRCDSPTIRGWLDSNQDNQIQEDEALAMQTDNALQKKLTHVICKFPTEWDEATIDKRWGWLMTETRENPTPLSQEDFDLFKAHVQALCFWGSVTGLPASPWRFHPKTFISLFRKCGWLSSNEMTQVIPRRFIAGVHGKDTKYRSSITLNQAQTRVSGIVREFNIMMRKFLITSPQRQAIFIANAVVEASYLSKYYEGGRGSGTKYGDWYGRGIIQITWEENYLAYFKYRGRNVNNAAQNITWRNNIETDNHERCESAGFWWVKNKGNIHASPKTDNQNWAVSICEGYDWKKKMCTKGSTNETRLSNPTLDTVGRLINTGSVNTTVRVNGLTERRDLFTHAQAVLMEVYYPDAQGNMTLVVPSFFTRQQ